LGDRTCVFFFAYELDVLVGRVLINIPSTWEEEKGFTIVFSSLHIPMEGRMKVVTEDEWERKARKKI
jgi:hypothetical protein